MKTICLSLLAFITVFSACSPIPTAFPAEKQPSISAPTLTPTPPLSPQPTITPLDPVTVTAFCTLIDKDPETHIKQNTPVIITWGWEAKTEAQIEDFLKANRTIITLDGKEIEGEQVEGIQKNQKSGYPEVVWYAKVGVLPSGAHTITYDVSWTKMIDDGSTTYGPGGKIETTHDECRIVVE